MEGRPLYKRLMVLGWMLALVGPALAQDPGGLSDAEIQQILAIHNRERAEVGVSPLTWSTQVSAHAGEWARILQGEGCQLRHRDQGRKYGENIADLINPGYPAATAPERWAEEKQDYNGEAIGDPESMNPWHYTQMVWRNTTELGCGVAWCGENGILICNYNPGGNVSGEKPY